MSGQKKTTRNRKVPDWILNDIILQENEIKLKTWPKEKRNKTHTHTSTWERNRKLNFLSIFFSFSPRKRRRGHKEDNLCLEFECVYVYPFKCRNLCYERTEREKKNIQRKTVSSHPAGKIERNQWGWVMDGNWRENSNAWTKHILLSRCPDQNEIAYLQASEGRGGGGWFLVLFKSDIKAGKCKENWPHGRLWCTPHYADGYCLLRERGQSGQALAWKWAIFIGFGGAIFLWGGRLHHKCVIMIG